VGEISVKTGNNARNGGKNSLNRLIRCVCGKKSAQIREILISESAWEEMTCLFAPSLSEDDLEQQCLKWFAEQDWEVLHGPDIAPDGDNPLRASFHDVFLRPVMLEQLQTINPHLPVSVLEEVILRIARPKPGSGRQQQSIPSPAARRRAR
jgi:hypothetical protein